MTIEKELLTRAADLIGSHTGLLSPESHHSHLQRILSRMCREKNQAPDELVAALPQTETLHRAFINQAMIGETYFFREEAQFRLLITRILPELFRQRDRITLWSASCSTGEEALSLAAAAWTAAGSLNPAQKFRVYASDINSDSLDHLRQGLYGERSFRQDGREFHSLLRGIPSDENREVAMAPEVMAVLEIRQLNLFKDSLEPIPDSLDVIFFRNTLIYAPEANRKLLIHRLTEKLRPGGVLFTASSEAPFIEHPLLSPEERDKEHYFRRRETPLSEDKQLPRQKSFQPPPRRTAPSPIPQEPTGPPRNPDKKPHRLILLKKELENLNYSTAAPSSADGETVIRRLKEEFRGEINIPLLEGWFYRSRGETQRACRALRQAARKEADWIPLFFLAGLIRQSDPAQARGVLRDCLDFMTTEPDRGDDLDQQMRHFLCGGFDKPYFRHLCEGWLRQLATPPTAEGERHGP